MDVNQYSPDSNETSGRLSTQIRREQIALAALNLISQQGLESLSIAGIAKEIGLVPSAIYRHFSGKKEILYAVNDLIRNRLLGIVKHVCSECSDPIERLRKLLSLHVSLIKTHNGIPRYVFSVESSADHPDRQEHLYQTIQLYLGKVSGIIKDGQLSGRICKDLDADAISYMFLGLLQPAIFLNHLSAGQFDIEAQTEQAWNVFRETIITTE